MSSSSVRIPLQVPLVTSLLVGAFSCVGLVLVGLDGVDVVMAGGAFTIATFTAVSGMQEEETLAGRLRWLLWPQIALVVIITWMAYQRLVPTSVLTWPYADKVLHFLLFGLVAFFAELWLDGRRWGWAPLAILFPFSVAAVEEAAQMLSPNRTFDLGDLACDFAGMVLAWGVARFILRREAFIARG